MDSGLRDKIVLVTGASGGIGAETARVFAAEGASLVLHYHRNRTVAESLQKELAPTHTLLLGADLRNETEVAALFALGRQHFGRIDTLVANAGIWVEQDVPITDLSFTQWQQTLDSDLNSVFLCCREFSRIVAHQRQGNIVLVSSTAGIFGEAGHVDYATAKSAIASGLTLTLKNEMARLAPHTADYCGGRVNCVCPGWTLTPMAQHALADEAVLRRATATMALPHLAQPRDVANAIVFLASDRLARHLTGQVLVIAGGMEGRILWQPDETDLNQSATCAKHNLTG
jgi:3-oxoacyl-[acyl-carrier protein] reductase